jgi:putative ABC transport system permease protein
MLSMVENLLLLVTLLVLIAALIGMMTTLLAAMKERQREMAILRAVGARPWQLFWLIELEVLCLTLLSIGVALATLSGGLWLAQPLLSSQYGLVISIWPWHAHTGVVLSALTGLSLVLGAIPSYLTYRQSVAQGLVVKL